MPVQGNCQDPDRCVGLLILSPNPSSGIKKLGLFLQILQVPRERLIGPTLKRPPLSGCREHPQRPLHHEVIADPPDVHTDTVVPPVVQLSLVVQFADHGLSGFPTRPEIF